MHFVYIYVQIYSSLHNQQYNSRDRHGLGGMKPYGCQRRMYIQILLFDIDSNPIRVGVTIPDSNQIRINNKYYTNLYKNIQIFK